MARYHFATADGTYCADEEGVEMTGIQAAKLEGARLCGEILKDRPETLWDDGHFRVIVTNEANMTAFEILVIAIPAPVIGNHR